MSALVEAAETELAAAIARRDVTLDVWLRIVERAERRLALALEVDARTYPRERQS